MTLEKITPTFIEKLLKIWKRGNFSLQDLESIDQWLQNMGTLEEKQLSLREKLYYIVFDNIPKSCHSAIAANDIDKIHRVLKELFKDAPSDAGYLALIYARYLDIRKHSISELATGIGVSEKTLRRYLLKGLEIISLKIKADIQKTIPLKNFNSATEHFPSVDANQVIGINNIVDEISTWFLDELTYPAISIEGIGGIGKTLLAKHLWQRLHQTNSFEGYAWVSARQKEISLFGEIASVEDFATTLGDIVARLSHQLGQTHLAGLSTAEQLKGLEKISKQNRFLIVLDNLETLKDVEDTIPALLKLTEPSKLLVTSRKSLSKFPQVRTFSTPELSVRNSHLLIISEMQQRGITLPLSEETIVSLYNVTGGIPLALKLAAAQFGFYPVNEIIEQFRKGKENTQNMYVHIYRRAWMLLSDTAKRIMLSMLLVSPEGEERHWICEIGGFSDEEFDAGLMELKRLSLIEFSGSIETPLYRIHRLTTTFLQSNIVNEWKSG